MSRFEPSFDFLINENGLWLCQVVPELSLWLPVVVIGGHHAVPLFQVIPESALGALICQVSGQQLDERDFPRMGWLRHLVQDPQPHLVSHVLDWSWVNHDVMFLDAFRWLGKHIDGPWSIKVTRATTGSGPVIGYQVDLGFADEDEATFARLSLPQVFPLTNLTQ